MTNKHSFQYCPKLIVFSRDKGSVLLVRRTGEQDYDGAYTFIGGKLETTDESLLSGIKREKDEEIGPNARILICENVSCYQVLFKKKDGNKMVIPHHAGIFNGGDIDLNPEEYSGFTWAAIDSLDKLEPKVSNIPDTVRSALLILNMLSINEFHEI